MNFRPEIKANNAAPDWQQIRSRFPVLENKTYLNSCSYGALAIDVKDAFKRYLRDREEQGTDWNYWVEVWCVGD